MAKIKLASAGSVNSGSIGGQTIQATHYGVSMRNKRIPLVPNNPGQQDTKSRSFQITKAWRELTPAQRQTWIDFATNHPQPTRRDASKFLSGFGVFVKWQQSYLLQNDVKSIQIFTAPPEPGPDNNANPELLRLGSTLNLVFGFASQEFDYQVSTFISPIVSAGLFFPPNLIQLGITVADVVDAIDIFNSYTSRVGAAPGIGNYVFVQFLFSQIGGGRVIRSQAFRVRVATGSR